MQSPKHPEAQQKNNISAPAAAPRHAKTRSRRADRLQSQPTPPTCAPLWTAKMAEIKYWTLEPSSFSLGRTSLVTFHRKSLSLSLRVSALINFPSTQKSVLINLGCWFLVGNFGWLKIWSRRMDAKTRLDYTCMHIGVYIYIYRETKRGGRVYV